MYLYKNLSGDSGVSGYEIGVDFIKVHFKGREGEPYVYSYASTGRKDVEKMKKLATRGEGLSTYISQHVRERYEKK